MHRGGRRPCPGEVEVTVVAHPLVTLRDEQHRAVRHALWRWAWRLSEGSGDSLDRRGMRPVLTGGQPFPLPPQPFGEVDLGLVAEQGTRLGQVGSGRVDITGPSHPARKYSEIG